MCGKMAPCVGIQLLAIKEIRLLRNLWVISAGRLAHLRLVKSLRRPLKNTQILRKILEFLASQARNLVQIQNLRHLRNLFQQIQNPKNSQNPQR